MENSVLTLFFFDSHLFLTFSSAFYSGILFDKGWFGYQLAIGSVGWLVGISTLSFAKTYWQILLAQSVCMGLSLGLMFSPCLSILGTYFCWKRAAVVGVAASGTASWTVRCSGSARTRFRVPPTAETAGFARPWHVIRGFAPVIVRGAWR